MLCMVCLVLQIGTTMADDDLKQRASWDWPSLEAVRSRTNTWIAKLKLEDKQLEAIEAVWSETRPGRDLLEPVIDIVAIADETAADFIRRCRSEQAPSLPDFEQIESEQYPDIVAQQLRLLYGKTLAMQFQYNEAKDQLDLLDVEQVAAPATLMFYRAAANYRVREFAPTQSELDKLLERDSELPDRYSSVANLMKADLKQLKPDSLDEIARIMDSIKVRLNHGRAGKRVRDEEQEVIDKLSKMIEEKEQQLQQMQAQSSGQGGGNQSDKPMQDSQLPGGGGAGDVDAKKMSKNSDWGNLPPKERKQALQELGKEFPSHYRDVIEEYFRNLARDESLDK